MLRFPALIIALLFSASLSAAEARRLSITEAGAVADAQTLNTQAIQKTIDQLAASGGGVAVIPKGTFLSGSIFLKAGVELHLDEGAVLLGSKNIEDYPKRETRIEGHFEPWRMALVNAQQMDRVRISGKGKFDGNGIMYWAAFWQRRKENPRCTNLEVERPRLMFIDRCTDVRVEDVSLTDSGFWNLHLYRCQKVVLEGLRITAPTTGRILGPSTDGIDIDSSQDVTVRKCYISVNDDNIALKGSKGPEADKDKDSPPVEKILVEDCEFGDGNGVITCGSEATTVRDVIVRNCKVTGRTNLLTLKLRPDTPQHYHDILVENVTMAGGGRILNVNPWLQFFDLKGHPAPDRTIERVTIRNITGHYGTLGSLRGNRGDTLRDITLENIDLKIDDTRFPMTAVANFAVKSVKINGVDFVAPEPVAPPEIPTK